MLRKIILIVLIIPTAYLLPAHLKRTEKVVAWDIHQVLCTEQGNHGYECQPIEETFQLVRELNAKGVRQVILSNISRRSFGILCSKYPEYFQLFDKERSLTDAQGIFTRKPHDKYYKKFLNKIGLDAKQIVFFDDKKVNVMSACCSGINAYQFNNSNQARTILQQNGLL